MISEDFASSQANARSVTDRSSTTRGEVVVWLHEIGGKLKGFEPSLGDIGRPRGVLQTLGCLRRHCHGSVGRSCPSCEHARPILNVRV